MELCVNKCIGGISVGEIRVMTYFDNNNMSYHS